MSLSEEENQAIAAKLEAKRQSDAAIAAFLANGGTIIQVPAGQSGIVPGQGNMWGRSRKRVAEVVEETTDLDEVIELDLDLEEIDIKIDDLDLDDEAEAAAESDLDESDSRDSKTD